MKRHFRIYSENFNPPPILSLYYLLLFVIIVMYILVDLPFDNSEFAMTLKHLIFQIFLSPAKIHLPARYPKIFL